MSLTGNFQVITLLNTFLAPDSELGANFDGKIQVASIALAISFAISRQESVLLRNKSFIHSFMISILHRVFYIYHMTCTDS